MAVDNKWHGVEEEMEDEHEGARELCVARVVPGFSLRKLLWLIFLFASIDVNTTTEYDSMQHAKSSVRMASLQVIAGVV